MVVKCCRYVSYLWQGVHAFCLLPIKKDAPIPRNVVSQLVQQMDPDLAHVLYNVLCRDSKWMTVNHNCVHIIRIRLKYRHSTLPLYLFNTPTLSIQHSHFILSLLTLSVWLQYTYVVLKVLLQLDVVKLP